MPRCTCEHPNPGADPRTATSCVKCGRMLPLPEERTSFYMDCAKCGKRFDAEAGRCGLYFADPGDNFGRQTIICSGCAEVVKAWLVAP